METKLDEQIKEPIILLSELNILKSRDYYDSYNSYTGEEAKDIVRKDLNLKDYFKINNETTKELISNFRQSKLKIGMNNKHFFLKNGKLYILSDESVKIYDEKMYQLYQINLEPNHIITSGIELDNNDLVLISYIKTDNKNNKDDFFYFSQRNTIYELLIYRLKDKNYILQQKIKEDMTGYKLQYSYSGCIGEPKVYEVEFLKEISGNRFICVTNYGFKIYSLNEKCEYSYILLDVHLEGIKKILEINENNFIFCTDKHYGASMGGPAHNTIIIEIIKINEMPKNETIFEYSNYGGDHNISDSLIIKNTYFIIIFDLHNILIFNVKDGKQVKRYGISEQINHSLNFYGIDIKPWDSVNENEFLIIIDGNIILFELNEDKNENVELRIINQFYFPNIKKLTKIKDKKNKFYTLDEKYINFDKRNISLYLY